MAERETMKIPNWIIQGALSVIIALIGWGLKDTVEQLRATRTDMSHLETEIAVIKSEAAVPKDPPPWFVKRMDELSNDVKELKAQVTARNRAGRHADAVGHGGPVLGFDAGQ